MHGFVNLYKSVYSPEWSGLSLVLFSQIYNLMFSQLYNGLTPADCHQWAVKILEIFCIFMASHHECNWFRMTSYITSTNSNQKKNFLLKFKVSHRYCSWSYNSDFDQLSNSTKKTFHTNLEMVFFSVVSDCNSAQLDFS